MLSNLTGVSYPPTTRSAEVDTNEGWGSLRFFQRMTGMPDALSVYWIETVHRPAHLVAHPRLNINGCPGCVFEQAVA